MAETIDERGFELAQLPSAATVPSFTATAPDYLLMPFPCLVNTWRGPSARGGVSSGICTQSLRALTHPDHLRTATSGCLSKAPVKGEELGRDQQCARDSMQ
ncbi:hypothetical protein [Streptomyces sp. NPDC097610]|uniref:hypothetical protein n=1 Tax=Streptomyces sp. NPDC097610 TaxID=3157227 RepID=UPI00332C61F5